MEALLEIDNIEVVYNKSVQVLRGLSLRVPKGAIVALLGSNGAGKSTTLKSVSGLLTLEDGEVTAGEVRFRGTDVKGVPPERRVREGGGGLGRGLAIMRAIDGRYPGADRDSWIGSRLA